MGNTDAEDVRREVQIHCKELKKDVDRKTKRMTAKEYIENYYQYRFTEFPRGKVQL